MIWNASSILNKFLVHFLPSNSAFHDFEPKYKELYMVWAVFGPHTKWQLYGMNNLQTPSLSKISMLKFATRHCACAGYLRLTSARDHKFSKIFFSFVNFLKRDSKSRVLTF